ncbi:hypothetical protein KXD93_00955 [Mucilaginibacter sp. BJC16-A38]|uniref:hypothetical protein n=1 Tax=Mucilaginibacter phenanthrenivorans TaxID=1234842 RepID=UPI002157C5A0|nr:hypothetical protein [Mucilaginibacter phenanthrenivorans]MCR8556187.1 hypothetical protein [Mucilaginibacter phenanthrenivorans]
MKMPNIENYKTVQLIILIAVIIIVIPALLLQPAFFKFWNFSNSASIGETIGGITSPFINGIAAILVFIAFKAQIKANQIITNQEKSRNILSQITLVQDDKLEIDTVILSTINRSEYLQSSSIIQIINALNKILFFTSEIRLAYELIQEYEGEKDFLYRKLYYLYIIRYQTLFLNLNAMLNNELANVHKDYELIVVELLLQIKYLNENLKDVTLYK